ncbi:MAG TPA: formate dehydrogenase accessory protein FdhE [Burkholderiales bacterium]|nr:formate dehydrogenase accessory protein FdhE [Burkholderiales bacterium]
MAPAFAGADYSENLCARCGSQWRVDRLSCALCGNRAPDSLEYFHGDGETAWRIDPCASGRHYIKTIDARGLEAPDPVLEDLATLHLDVLAAEKGYSRGASNPWSPS